MAKKFIVEGKAADLSPNQVYVKSGDTLSQISQQLTGSANNWRKIAEANNITDPLKIKPGQVISIPQNIFNPVVSLGGKDYRQRSPEYRSAYESTKVSPKDRLAAYRQEQAQKGAEAVRTGINKAGTEIFSTALNTLDLPRRVVAAATNTDYNIKDALNVVGTQPYKSVVGDEYAAKHPYIAMGADLGTGLLAWNLPGIAKSIVGTGANLARSEAAIAKAIDNTRQMASQPAKVAKEAAKQSRQSANKTMTSNPNKYEVVTIFPEGSSGTAAGKVSGNTRISNTVGARVDPNRGAGFTGPKSSRTTVGRGKTQSAYTPGSEHVGGFQYAIPIPAIVRPGFVPIPGIPGYPSTPPVVSPLIRERIEEVQPAQRTLTDIINTYKAQPGDTLQFPSGEQVVYKRGNAPKERVFDVTTTKVFDAAKTPTQQYNIPGRTQVQWSPGQASVGKYTPAVPKQEQRNKKVYYPTLVSGKAKDKPLK